MATLAKLAFDFSAPRIQRTSGFAVVCLFSLIGLAVTLLAAHYGIEVGDAM